MDARVRIYYKLTLWAWRLRWAKKELNVVEDSDSSDNELSAGMISDLPLNSQIQIKMNGQ